MNIDKPPLDVGRLDIECRTSRRRAVAADTDRPFFRLGGEQRSLRRDCAGRVGSLEPVGGNRRNRALRSLASALSVGALVGVTPRLAGGKPILLAQRISARNLTSISRSGRRSFFNLAGFR